MATRQDSNREGTLAAVGCVLAVLPILLLLSGAFALADETALQPYVDQILDPLPEDDPVSDRSAATEPLGRRSLSTEFRYYGVDRKDLGRLDEFGLIGQWRRETLNYGELELSGVLRTASSDISLLDEDGSGGNLTFNQYALPIGEAGYLDNTLGLMRSDTTAAIANGYRINLPSSFLNGARTQFVGERNSLSLSYGQVGTLEGRYTQTFDRQDAKLLGVGYEQIVGLGWAAGAQLWSLRDDDDIPDHESVAGFLSWADPGGRQEHILRGLVDSKGSNGFWYDGILRRGAWLHRAGLYRLDPKLLWTDAPISNDQQGVYLRSDLQRLEYSASLGFDLRETNIDDRDDRVGFREAIGFLSLQRRLNRLSSVGATLRLADRNPRDSSGSSARRGYRLDTYLNHRFPLGTGRFQLSWADYDSPGSDRDRFWGLRWDQDWLVRPDLLFRSTLSGQRDEDDLGSARSMEGGLMVQGTPSARLRWSLEGDYVRVSGDRALDTDAVNLRANMDWRFARNWRVGLELNWNSLKLDQQVALFDDRDETSVFFTLGYDLQSGRPIQVLGGTPGDSGGSGAIVGLVFYDDNGDGVQQPGERGAQGISIRLDGRYLRVTRADGKFDFDPVAAGGHSLRLGLEDVPLPWGLLDERPIGVDVAVRFETEVAIPLMRLDQ